MTDPLAGARMKLQRAEEHWGQLSSEHAAFLVRNPYRMLREHDFDRGDTYYLWRAKIVEPPPYERWSSLIGECAHSLRSALDHTAYAIVTATGSGSAIDRTYFPILDDPDKWASVHPNCLPGVTSEVLSEVKALQPFNRSHHSDHLWIIHMLDIIDKHRRLGLIAATVSGTLWHASRGEVSDVDPGIGPFEDGSVVGRFRLAPKPPDPGVELITHFVFDISIADGEPGERDSAIGLLENLRSYAGAVVARFERFL